MGNSFPASRHIVSLAEAEELARRLYARIYDTEFSPDVVVGIANGGAYPAVVVAGALGRPCRLFRVQRKSTALKQWLAFARKPLGSRMLQRPARSVSRYLDQRFTNTRALSAAPFHDLREKCVLVIDDCIDTGASMALVRAALADASVREIRVGVLSWMNKHDSVSLHGVKPDYYLGRTLPAFPWSLENPEFNAFRLWLAANAELMAPQQRSD